MELNQMHLRRGLLGCQCPQGKGITSFTLKHQYQYTRHKFSQLGF